MFDVHRVRVVLKQALTLTPARGVYIARAPPASAAHSCHEGSNMGERPHEPLSVLFQAVRKPAPPDGSGASHSASSTQRAPPGPVQGAAEGVQSRADRPPAGPYTRGKRADAIRIAAHPFLREKAVERLNSRQQCFAVSQQHPPRPSRPCPGRGGGGAISSPQAPGGAAHTGQASRCALHSSSSNPPERPSSRSYSAIPPAHGRPERTQ